LTTRYDRPAKVQKLLVYPSKAKAEPGWVREITLDDMVAKMVTSDLQRARQHALFKKTSTT
jgi:GDPmannose 4,6-dehydratase